jgi:hypothetical protein
VPKFCTARYFYGVPFQILISESKNDPQKKRGRKFRFHVMKSWMFSQERKEASPKVLFEEKVYRDFDHRKNMTFFNKKTKKRESSIKI